MLMTSGLSLIVLHIWESSFFLQLYLLYKLSDPYRSHFRPSLMFSDMGMNSRSWALGAKIMRRNELKLGLWRGISQPRSR